MEHKPIPGQWKPTSKVTALTAHQAKKVAIDTFFITLKIKILHKMSLIDRPTLFPAKLILRKQQIPKVNKIPARKPPLFKMFTFPGHVMYRVHVIRLLHIIVHDMVSKVKRREPVGKQEQFVVDLLVWSQHLLLGQGLVHEMLLEIGHVVVACAQVLSDEVVHAEF